MFRFEEFVFVLTAMQYIRIIPPNKDDKHHKVIISMYATDLEVTGAQGDRLAERLDATWPEVTRQSTDSRLVVPTSPLSVIGGGRK